MITSASHTTACKAQELAARHTISLRFWRCYEALPPEIQSLAEKNFTLLKADPSHPSLQFQWIAGRPIHSMRVGLHYRALGLSTEEGVHWFWIGSHADDDRLISS